jgi:hypothetical protein
MSSPSGFVVVPAGSMVAGIMSLSPPVIGPRPMYHAVGEVVAVIERMCLAGWGKGDGAVLLPGDNRDVLGANTAPSFP